MKTEKNLLSITNNGLINNYLKDIENYNKKHEDIIKIDMIIWWWGQNTRVVRYGVGEGGGTVYHTPNHT